MASTESSVRPQTHSAHSVTVRRTRWQPMVRSVIFNAVLLFGAFRLSFLLDVRALDAGHTADFQLAAAIHARRQPDGELPEHLYHHSLLAQLCQ